MKERHPDLELVALVDGDLPPGEEARVLAHLAECGRCRRLLAGLQEVEEALEDWGLPPAERGLTGRILARAREGTGAPPPGWSRRRLLWLLPAAAAAGAIALLLPRSRAPGGVACGGEPPEELLEMLDFLEELEVLERVERFDHLAPLLYPDPEKRG